MITRFALGDYRCALINVGRFDMRPEWLFVNAPADALAAARARHDMTDDPLVFQVNPLFVDTGSHRVVVDPGGTEDGRRLSEALGEAGIDPGTIDALIITHGHADHYSGCVHPDGAPAFPNARHYIQRADWDYFTTADDPEPPHGGYFRQTLAPLREYFTLLDGDGEILPGFEAIGTPGHTPGHMAVKIGGRAVHAGDVLQCVVYVEHPDWYANDLHTEQVVETRRRLLQQVVEENLLVMTLHFRLPGTGRVSSADGALRWCPEPGHTVVSS